MQIIFHATNLVFKKHLDHAKEDITFEEVTDYSSTNFLDPLHAQL